MSSKLPTVAIIGRANAGKSSIFNRLTRGENLTERAIVAREAGTTRDNVVAKVSLASKKQFWLVDTAGLKNPDDEFEANIQDQIDDAVDAADVILVVVDSTEFPDDDVRRVAKKALKSKKPVILLLNKVDLKGALASDEFLRLGVKDMIPISAQQGTNFNKLREKLTNILPDASERPDENILKVALIGRPNVGKSHLFNALAGKQQALVANIAGTTRDIGRASVKFHGRALEILDTAGVRRSGKIEKGIEQFSVLRTVAAIEESDVCLLLIDVNELATQLDQKLAGMIADAGKGLVIVVTKWDALEEKTEFSRDEIAPKLASIFDFVPWAPLIFTSAVTGKNVTKLFELAAEIDTRRKTEISTRELNKVLTSAVQNHPPAGLKNTHPKFRYIVQTDVRPPWFVIYGSNFKFIHWSYKRYLERRLRDTFGFAGTPIKFSFRDEKQMKANREKDRSS